jgi:DNA-binding transcriptional MerR regulator
MYPMRTVVRLTGVAPDTLRAWERRYDAVVPTRTEGNARRYSEHDVARLRRLRDAVASGHSIGDVVRLGDEALDALVGKAKGGTSEAPDSAAALRASFLEAIERLDARSCQEILGRAALLVPPRTLALEFLRPVLHEVGERWHAGRLSIAAEHLASAQIRGVVESLRRLQEPPSSAPRLVLAAPSEHRHELGLALGSLLAIQRGVEPIMLGGDLPLREIEDAAQRLRAEAIVLGVARSLRPAERGLVAEIRALGRRREVWVGAPEGHALAALKAPVRVLTSLEAFDHALAHRFPPLRVPT